MMVFKLVRLIRSCLCDRSGQFALGFALLMPLIFGLAGGAIDLVAFERNMKRMQDAADHAALAATREGSLQGWNEQIASEVAMRFASENLGQTVLNNSDGSSGPQSSPGGEYRITTKADSVKKSVLVTIENDYYPYFYLGYFRHSPQIRVSAEARASSETPVCLVALDPAQTKSVNIIDSAVVSANGCAAYSNSADKDGLFVEAKASFASAFTCSSGGYGETAQSFQPKPTVDCPVFADPLSDRPQPSAGKCDKTALKIKNTDVTLAPGVYCNGLTIDNWAVVQMKPGLYIIDGGELGVKNSGKLTGDGVTIYFTGKDGRLKLDGTTTVNLTAPETGPTAGLLLMQDRNMDYTDFEISSQSAAELLGTIYLPNGRLLLNAPGNIAESSAFTVVVARTLEVGKKTRMFLNSNYGASAVPVPEGVGPQNSVIRLVD